MKPMLHVGGSNSDALRDPLEGGAFPRPSDRPDARSARERAIRLGEEIAGEDLRLSGAYDLAETRALLRGATRRQVEDRVREGRLIAVSGPDKMTCYPAAQFNEDGTVVEGLAAVLEVMPTKNSFAILNYLIHPDSLLGGRTPIDLLKAGEIDLVVEAARRLGVQGA